MHNPCRLALLTLLLVGCEADNSPLTPTATAAKNDKAVADASPVSATSAAPTTEPGDAAAEHAAGQWQLPVLGVAASALEDNWGDARSGTRTHEGMDIMAPRGTPVIAAADGMIRKLFVSKRGGNTIYLALKQHDYILYYAHLEAYAEGITEGLEVKAGTVLGYVGTSGNAPQDAPHLHFAVHDMQGSDDWWRGEAINPFGFFQARN